MTPKTSEARVMDLIRNMPTSDDGSAVIVEGNIELKLETAEEWLREWAECDEMFRKWCKSHARRGVERPSDIFGPSAALLDIPRMEVLWPAWFADKLATYTATSLAVPGASLRLAEQLSAQLQFECDDGLAAVGNTALYPDHMRMIGLLSGTAQEWSGDELMERLADQDAYRAHERIYQQLNREWLGDADAESALQALCEHAAAMSVKGEYNADAVFDAFRLDVWNWAIERVDARGAPFEAAVDKIAAKKMLASEDAIAKAIREATKTSEDPTPAYRRDRLAGLKKGTEHRL